VHHASTKCLPEKAGWGARELFSGRLLPRYAGL
jgi:hypothetical protein